jgi:hypothetical protein
MIGSFIAQVYDCQLLHSTLAYQPPAEFEATPFPYERNPLYYRQNIPTPGG